MIQLTQRQQDIVNIITAREKASISDIKEQLREDISTPTLNRDLAALVAGNYLTKTGKGRATSYKTSYFYRIFCTI